MSARTVRCGMLLSVLCLAACTSNGPAQPLPCSLFPQPGACDLGTATASLTRIDGCDDLRAAMRLAAYEEMRQRVLSGMDAAIQDGRYGECDPWCCGVDGGVADGGSAGTDGGSGGEEGAEEYSTTNTQEVGVDEADFVKNDGNTIYLLSGDRLLILDAWPPPETHVLSSTRIGGSPRLLYVHADRAVIYSDFISGTGSSTLVTVLDITDKRSPRPEREIVFSGAYVDSRRIGEAVHTVVDFPVRTFWGMDYTPDELRWCGNHLDAEVQAAYLRLLESNKRFIDEIDLSEWLPTVRDTRILPDGNTVENPDPLAACSGFYKPSIPGGTGLLSVTSVDLLEPEDLEMSSIIGNTGVVYASLTSLYVATQYSYDSQGAWFFPDAAGTPEATTVHKFSLSHSPAAVVYQASGVVEGRVLDQFSLGEHEGNLRMATTTGQVWQAGTHNSILVLDQEGASLRTIGSITGIAPTEDIRSARFVGDRAFVVTFKKTDPLYTVDLSDPQNPRILGELKIPGFSTYMHLMDHDHLLTIGFDAQDEGSFAWFQGVALQIFDVTDMQNPALLHKEVIGTRGTSSEATGDHMAFNYFPPKEILALPMAICEDSAGGGAYGSTLSFSGLLVYDVTLTAGFAERGRVAHAEPTDDPYGCQAWWTDPASHVQRSIIMDDYVFSLSDAQLKVNHLDALGADIVTIPLPGGR